MEVFFWFFILFLTLFFLIRSADIFTDHSERVGIALGISSLVIGSTIVAIGTSLPELLSSLFALSSGETVFVVDNIVGSNIANALLILGIGGIVARGLKAKTRLIEIEIPFFFMSMALFTYFALNKSISRVEGIILSLFLILFILYQSSQKSRKEIIREVHKKKEEYKQKLFSSILFIIGSAVILSISAKYLVTSILTLSHLLGITSSLLTITIVAFGTSLPEIITSISAIRRGNHEIAIGNVLGSNTFNLLLIGGIPAIIHPLSISSETMRAGIPFLVIATFIAIFVLHDDRVAFWEGASMIFFYLVFITKILGII